MDSSDHKINKTIETKPNGKVKYKRTSGTALPKIKKLIVIKEERISEIFTKYVTTFDFPFKKMIIPLAIKKQLKE